LLSNSIVYGLGSVANRLIGLLFLPVFTRYLSPADYGVVGLSSSVAMLLLPLFSFGVGTSLGVCYFATTDTVRRASVVRSAQALCWLSAALLFVAASFASAPLAAIALSDSRYEVHTLVTLIGVAFNVLALPLQQQFQFQGRAVAYTAAAFAGVAANVATSLVAVMVQNLGALGLLLGMAAGQAVTWLALRALAGNLRTSSRVNSRDMADLLRHGVPIIPSFLLLFVLQNAVRWPLEWQHGMGAVGLYTLGAAIGSAITIVTTSVTAAWMPHALSQAPQWSRARVRIADDFLRYCVLGGILLALFFVCAQPVLRIFVAAEYFRAWTVVGLSATSQLLVSLFSLMLPPVYLAKRVAVVLLTQAVAVAFTVAAFVLVPPLEIVGAALAVAIGSAALVVAQWAANKRIRAVEPIPLAVPALLRVAAIVAAAGTATFLLPWDNTGLFLVASAATLAAAATAMLREFPGEWRSILAKGREQ
jgi:O-antigen/teichoic acid export membrane protein